MTGRLRLRVMDGGHGPVAGWWPIAGHDLAVRCEGAVWRVLPWALDDYLNSGPARMRTAGEMLDRHDLTAARFDTRRDALSAAQLMLHLEGLL